MRIRAVVLFVVLALAAAAPSAARGVEPHCGSIIMTDTRLTADLVACGHTGLAIGADGVTLDLNGHHIQGGGGGRGVGIRIEGHDDVTIEHGSVEGFGEGVFARGTDRLTIHGLTSTGEGHGGILIDGARDATVDDSTVRRSGAGIIVTRSDGVLVRDNRISRSAFGGIPIFESRGVVVVGNTVTLSATDMAIGLMNGSASNAVVGNRVSRSAAGIVVADGGHDNVITGNVSHGNDNGVVLDAGTHDNRVARNLVEDTAYEGIVVVGSDRNAIVGNRVLRSGGTEPAGGIVVIPLPDDVSQTSEDNRLVANIALHNAGDGIHVAEGHANLLRGNRAGWNSQLGIFAAQGTRDGGDNRAAHNADPRQCVGVACATWATRWVRQRAGAPSRGARPPGEE